MWNSRSGLINNTSSPYQNRYCYRWALISTDRHEIFFDNITRLFNCLFAKNSLSLRLYASVGNGADSGTCTMYWYQRRLRSFLTLIYRIWSWNFELYWCQLRSSETLATKFIIYSKDNEQKIGFFHHKWSFSCTIICN